MGEEDIQKKDIRLYVICHLTSLFCVVSMAQDVFSKMAEDNWVLNEDGYLNVDTEVKDIIYHPSLNVILICTPSGMVQVLDVNSGVILQSSSLSGSKKCFS